MCGDVTRLFLTVWQRLFRELSMNILIKRTSEGDIDQLMSPANSENRYLMIESKLQQQKIVFVTASVRIAELGNRCFSQIFGIYVAPSRKNQSIELLYDRTKRMNIGDDRDQDGSAAGHYDGLEVRFCNTRSTSRSFTLSSSLAS